MLLQGEAILGCARGGNLLPQPSFGSRSMSNHIFREAFTTLGLLAVLSASRPTPMDSGSTCISEVTQWPNGTVELDCKKPCASPGCVSFPVNVGTPEEPIPAYTCTCDGQLPDPCCQVVRLDSGAPSTGGGCGGDKCPEGNACQCEVVQNLWPPYEVVYRNAHCTTM